METTGIETKTVLKAVRDIVPALRDNGLEAENRRWIPDENMDLLEKAGVFRMATPKVFGGLELSLSDQAKVLAEIARGCASTSWVAMVWASSAWMAGLYPEELQRELFADPSVRISGGFTPSGALTPTEGGYRLSGTWRFNSGCRGADWNMAMALLERPDGSFTEAIALVPMSEFTIADDWHTSSLAATGSSSSSVQDLFVPAHRVVTFDEPPADVAGAEVPAVAEAGTGRAYGLYGFLFSQAVGTFLGIAQGALELFLERLPGRGISYTSYTDQAQHPLTQIQIATAASKIAAAEALAEGLYTVLQGHADAGTEPTLEERARVRAHSAYAAQLAKEAVELLYGASGATVIQRAVPLQRFHRDIQGLALHGWILLNPNLEVYGRVLLGLDPDTQLL
ncbi:acyl-CoA dehydrogenase family protein [Kitasatospora sp. NPDC002040]|uniref:acyl-CoA dehydrogenase family protein n=1 Tax=Kitasatospora sp. NPDC002040 TaxID=3154661 RepID=UPI00332B8CB1